MDVSRVCDREPEVIAVHQLVLNSRYETTIETIEAMELSLYLEEVRVIQILIRRQIFPPSKKRDWRFNHRRDNLCSSVHELDISLWSNFNLKLLDLSLATSHQLEHQCVSEGSFINELPDDFLQTITHQIIIVNQKLTNCHKLLIHHS